MRRQDKEISSIDKILEILNNGHICNLGLSLKDRPYVVPMNYGYKLYDENVNGQSNHKLYLFLHCAKEGKKINILKVNNNVSFVIYTEKIISNGDIACDCTTKFLSLMGDGKIHFIDDENEKKSALDCIMQTQIGTNSPKYNSMWYDKVQLLMLEVENFCCKENK